MHCHKIFNRGASCRLEGAVTARIHLLGFSDDRDGHPPAADASPQCTALIFHLLTIFSAEMEQSISTGFSLAYSQAWLKVTVCFFYYFFFSLPGCNSYLNQFIYIKKKKLGNLKDFFPR